MNALSKQEFHRVALPELTRRTVSVGQNSVLLDVPSKSDSVLEHSLSGQSENPYWGVLWDAALPMAEYLGRNNWGHQTDCLELGCGLGLTGIAAWKAGLPVLLTDIVPEAVELAVRNARLNGLANCRSAVLDWNQPPKTQYSTIVGCDILYERSQHAGLLTFLKAASTPETEIHIGDPGRQCSQKFAADAADEGFRVEILRGGEILSGADLLSGRPSEMAAVDSLFQVFVLRRQHELSGESSVVSRQF